MKHLFIVVLIIGLLPPAAAQTTDQGQQQVILDIQSGLARLGYDPGSPDGLMGGKTRAAISAFQRSQNIQATGRPTTALRDRIKQLIEARDKTPSATNATTNPVSPAPPAKPAAPRPQQNNAADRFTGNWNVTDESGARFTISLLNSGRVLGAADPDRWSWRRAGTGIVIEYNNGWGTRITRTAILRNGALAGKARSGDKEWGWRAERVPNKTRHGANLEKMFRKPL